MSVNVQLRDVVSLAFLYLWLTLVFFFCGWMNITRGVILSICITIAILKLRKSVKDFDDSQLALPYPIYWVGPFVILFVFILLTGSSSFIGVNGVDIPWRNAIYYDLIRNPWPVIYEEPHAALTYYLTYWLPPALVSSFLSLGEKGSQTVLFIWTYLGLCLAFLLFVSHVKTERKLVLFAAFVFLFWAGLNLPGMIMKSIVAHDTFLIDDYPGFSSWFFTSGYTNGGRYPLGYFIRSNFDSLANVYNQYIPMSLIVFIYLHLRKHWEVYALLACLALPFSPFGFLGLTLLMLGEFLGDLWKNDDKRSQLKQCISIPNVLAILSIFVVFVLYYTSNYIAQGTENSSIFFVPLKAYTLKRIGMLILYYLLFFGLYMICLPKEKRKDPLFWTILVVLMVLPIFKVGKSLDLEWNASLPGFLILMVWVTEQLIKAFKRKIFWGKNLCLLILIVIASFTPMMQMASTLRGCVLEKKISVYRDPQKVNGTFAGKDSRDYKNFLAVNYEESIFYKYLAKRS